MLRLLSHDFHIKVDSCMEWEGETKACVRLPLLCVMLQVQFSLILRDVIYQIYYSLNEFMHMYVI